MLEWFFTIVLWWFGICMAAVAIGLAYRKWRSRTPELAVAFNAEIAERERLVAHERRAFGQLYLITDKDLKNPQLWLTEEEGSPTDLFSRFGWYHHKRSRYAGSMSHQFTFLGEHIRLDPKLHKHFDSQRFAGEQRRLIQARHDALILEAQTFDIYVFIDRVKKVVKRYFVKPELVSAFLAEVVEGEFQTVMLAAKGVRLEQGSAQSIYVAGDIYRDPVEREREASLANKPSGRTRLRALRARLPEK